MINFRFHLVSLIAVFLALGLGILVGSTVVDQKIVNGLDSEIKHVRKENDERAAASRDLSKHNSELQQFIAETAPFAGDGRLDGLSIALVAERGVDSGVVKETEQALQAAGGDVPAVLWLDDSWKLDSDSSVQDLRSALDLTGSATAVRASALAMLAQRLGRLPAAGSTGGSKPGRATTSIPATATTTSSRRTTSTVTSTSVPAGVPAADVLDALEHAGFLSVTNGDASTFDTFPAYNADALVITGDDSHFAGTDLAASFVRSLAHYQVPTVVAAAYDAGSNAQDAPERGASLAPILDDQVLSRAASTVDDLELVQGRVATVLALATVGSGGDDIGHYGYGTGASAPLPSHPS